MTLLISVLYATVAIVGAGFALVELRMIWRFVRNRTAIREAVRPLGPSLAEHELLPAPLVTVQIPLYNERRAAEQVIRAAAAQDYPRDRFDVQVLDDSTDETREIVAQVVEELAQAGIRIEHIHRDDRSGYKAGALAAGLEHSEADFVALFDADFVPQPDFLRRVLREDNTFEDASVAFVQGRWAWAEPIEGLVASALALMLDRHFFIQKPTRAFIGNVTTFNGSAGIWRRSAIDEAGGWSANTLTEDLDLTFRCALLGLNGRYRQDVAVVNELPGHMRALKQQQHRWAKGNAQCVRLLTGRVIASRDILTDRIDETFLLAGYAIHPILLMNLTLWPWAVLYMNRQAFWIVQGIMALVFVTAPVSFALTAIERDGKLTFSSLVHILTAAVIGSGLMVNNCVGQLQGFLSEGGEFVRTPKAHHTVDGPEGEGSSLAPKTYRSPLDWTFYLEIVVMVYCALTVAMLVSNGELFWAGPLVFWGICLAVVAQMQLAPSPA